MKTYYFHCPMCGSDERFAAVNQDNVSLGCLIAILGGLLPWLLYADSTRNRVQCMNCGKIFRQPPLPQSPLSNYALAIIILIVLTIFALLIMVAAPEFHAWLPDYPAVASLVELVAKHPEAVVASVLPLFVILVVSGIVVSIVSNRRYRSELREHVHLEPLARFDMRPDPEDHAPRDTT